MANPVVHWEMWSKEPAKVSDFYAKVFGWNVQHMPEMDYRFVEAGGAGGIGGGIFQPKEGGPWPGNLALYVDVDDLAAYGKRIVEAGGKMVVENQEVPGMGSFSLFADPEGRVMGIWKSATR